MQCPSVLFLSCYPVSDDEEETANAASRLKPVSEPTRGVASGVAMETDGPGRVEPEGPKEQRTVFVSNLPAEVTKGQLRERFSEVS